MAVVANNTISKTVPTTITATTLGASDTLVYSSGTRQVLNLHNSTGGSLTVNIDGSGSTTIAPAGLGATVDVSSGFNIVCAAGARKVVPLDTISAYLQGTVTLTGASGLTAWVEQYA
jgi:hypothetical protein